MYCGMSFGAEKPSSSLSFSGSELISSETFVLTEPLVVDVVDVVVVPEVPAIDIGVVAVVGAAVVVMVGVDIELVSVSSVLLETGVEVVTLLATEAAVILREFGVLST